MKNIFKYILPLIVLSLLVYLVISIATLKVHNPTPNTMTKPDTVLYHHNNSTYYIIISPQNENAMNLSNEELNEIASEIMADVEYYKNY